MYRFFSSQIYAEKILLTGTDAYHIANVLRMQVSEKLHVVTQDGYLVLAEIITVKAEAVELIALEILDKFSKLNRVSLAQGLIKGDKMDYVIQKAVELGVTDIYLLKLSRCIVEYDLAKASKKVERWQRIAYEAAKQSKHEIIPQVHELKTLDEFLSSQTPTKLAVLAYEEEKNQSLKAYFKSNALNQDITFLVGPEGGFTPKEVEQAVSKGFTCVTLGKQILRTETAPLMLLAALKYEKEF